MRIISGKFGGRKLVSFKADHIRPTTDRIKEVIFNKLQAHIDEAVVLDLFSGTGNLALEAFSRGARSVIAVEKSSKSVAIIRKNCALLGVSNQDVSIHSQDVFSFLKKDPNCKFDIVLIDPPFTEFLADEVMIAMSDFIAHLQPHVKIFIESGKKEDLQNQYKQLKLTEQKDYGDKKLSLFQLESKG